MFIFVNESVSSEIEYIGTSVRLKPEQIDFLKKIDSNSNSNAIRIIIDRYIKQTRIMTFDKYLPVFAVGFLLIGIGTLLPNIYIGLTSIAVGIFMIFYSLYMYNRYRLKYEKGEKINK